MAVGKIQALQLAGAIVEIQFGLADPDPETWKALGESVPAPIRVAALIDTGASHTTIRRGATKSLRITPTATLAVRGVDGVSRERALGYFGTLIFPGGMSLLCTVFEGLPEDSPTACLLGRDVLMNGRLVYDGQNAACSFFIKGQEVPLLHPTRSR